MGRREDPERRRKTLGGTASTIISTLRGGAARLSASQGSGALGVVREVHRRAQQGERPVAFLAPVGIALGVVIDHWIHTSAEAEGKKFANTFLAPLPDAGQAAVREADRGRRECHVAEHPDPAAG